jgi:hypothetical protein
LIRKTSRASCTYHEATPSSPTGHDLLPTEIIKYSHDRRRRVVVIITGGGPKAQVNIHERTQRGQKPDVYEEETTRGTQNTGDFHQGIPRSREMVKYTGKGYDVKRCIEPRNAILDIGSS